MAMAAALALFLVPAAVAASNDHTQPKGVVELFTSQSCSSCPPADAVFGRLVEKGDVIALAYHVDYWNYLGWRDPLSSKKFTARQYGYAKSFGRESVYTPQVVIDGREHSVGSNEHEIEKRIEALAVSGRGLTVPVTTQESNGKVTITVGAGPGKGKANIVLVYFDHKSKVTINGGENSGRTVTYWHTVRDVQTVGMWDGKKTSVVMPSAVIKGTSTGGCAVLLQKMTSANAPGPILGATVVPADDGPG
jgi:hypothetical protein